MSVWWSVSVSPICIMYIYMLVSVISGVSLSNVNISVLSKTKYPTIFRSNFALAATSPCTVVSVGAAVAVVDWTGARGDTWPEMIWEAGKRKEKGREITQDINSTLEILISLVCAYVLEVIGGKRGNLYQQHTQTCACNALRELLHFVQPCHIDKVQRFLFSYNHTFVWVLSYYPLYLCLLLLRATRGRGRRSRGGRR